MEGPTSKKTNEPPKRANHKGNIKFLQSREAYHIMKGEDLLKGSLAYTNPHLLQQHISKQRLCAHTITSLTPFACKMHTKLKEEGLLFKSFCKSNMGNIENFMKRISNAKEHPGHESICLLGKNISQAGALECSIVNSIATTLFL